MTREEEAATRKEHCGWPRCARVCTCVPEHTCVTQPPSSHPPDLVSWLDQ